MTTPHMMPVRRDIRFALPADRAHDWHVQGAPVTHFMNALSLLFPAGERFFMDSVRNYRDEIHDPELKKQVAGFIGQEAMHTREHIEYNDLLQSAGLPAHKLDKRLWALLGWGKKVLPNSVQLAITIALEHYTAILANQLLSGYTHRIDGSVEGYKQMWLWHAMEETEHKAVSYDVWNTVMKPGVKTYLLRTGTMLATTLIFWAVVFDFHVRLMFAHRMRHGKLKGMWRLVKYLYSPKNGVFPSIVLEWLDYFRPGFHPWDHDNRVYLQGLDTLLANIDAANERYADQVAPRRVPLHSLPEHQHA
ncbi:metal-dependent hydrolase [Burkholderia pseudomallei]|uniref:metal-dependent hydrolase n=1 Tax=Burkholderia pseudomallei TaxID=28450 RepID=UPI0003D86E73|nr:metal-dependent hydrolase [Burkholderia pseudomallei]AHE31596.1 putative metal-dependent hydrolase family protein [Burkholderia pseudomallei NCTC 13178]